MHSDRFIMAQKGPTHAMRLESLEQKQNEFKEGQEELKNEMYELKAMLMQMLCNQTNNNNPTQAPNANSNQNVVPTGNATDSGILNSPTA